MAMWQDEMQKRITSTLLSHWSWLDWANRRMALLSGKGKELPYSLRPFGSKDLCSVCKWMVEVVEQTKRFDPDDLNDELHYVYRDVFESYDGKPYENHDQFLRDVITLRLDDLKDARIVFRQMEDETRLDDVEQGIILLHSWLGLNIGKEDS